MNINSYAATAVPDSPVGTAKPSQARRRRVWRALAAGLVGWLTVTTLGTSSARAATISNLWSPGPVT